MTLPRLGALCIEAQGTTIGKGGRRVDDEMALEGMHLVWSAYFADPDRAPPMPELRIASERSAEMVQSILAELPALEAGLARRIPDAWVDALRSLAVAVQADDVDAPSRRSAAVSL